MQANIITTDPEGKPLGLIVWADKNKLSTFGTQKGHPIVVRLSNIDAVVRNGLGVGGGRVVGMVPMVSCLLRRCINVTQPAMIDQ